MGLSQRQQVEDVKEDLQREEEMVAELRSRMKDHHGLVAELTGESKLKLILICATGPTDK